jgi:uridine phosphorylase
MPRRAVFHRFACVPGASEAIHLKPAAELAERVLLPGDPHRALAVAQALLDQPKMFNHHRGLWGYTGAARDGEPLTIQATGMGGPSAAIVVEELIALGARTFIRIGTCGALTDGHSIGDVLRVDAALALDGTSRALGADGRVEPDAELAGAIDAPGVVAASVDLFYDAEQPTGAEVVEMECATLFRVAQLRGARAAAVLGVSDTLAGERHRICAEHLEALGPQLGEAAWAALTR